MQGAFWRAPFRSRCSGNAASRTELGSSEAVSARQADRTFEPEAGLEPATCRLQGGCSSQLSYTGDPARVAEAREEVVFAARTS